MNRDCWLVVFNLLPLSDRLTLRQVNSVFRRWIYRQLEISQTLVTVRNPPPNFWHSFPGIYLKLVHQPIRGMILEGPIEEVKKYRIRPQEPFMVHQFFPYVTNLTIPHLTDEDIRLAVYPHLRTLRVIRDVPMPGLSYAGLSTLTNLEHLALNYQPIEAHFPTMQLKRLELHMCRVSDYSMETLSRLEYLGAWPDIPESLFLQLPNLTGLSVREYCGPGLYLTTLTQLEELETRVPVPLSAFPRLTKLTLHFNQDVNLLHRYGPIEQLTHLTLVDNARGNLETIAQLTRLTQLKLISWDPLSLPDYSHLPLIQPPTIQFNL